MKRLLTLIPSLVVCIGAANAGTINTYSSESAFLSAVYPGYYEETFSANNSGLSLSYSGNGYAYTVSDSYGLQTSYGWLQTIMAGDTITITITSGTVTAVGADFFAVNALAQPRATNITLTFSDGTIKTIASTTSTTTFTGYSFDRPITKLTIVPQSTLLAPRAAALDDLVFGTALPEPGTWILFSGGMGLLAFVKFRRR